MSYLATDSPLYKLLQTGSASVLPKGQVIHALDDRTKCNLIESGYIKRYRITHEGEKSVQVIYGPDNIFPLPPVLKTIYEMDIYRGPETYYYESMTAITIHSISLSDLETALNKNPALYKDLLFVAGTRLNSYIHRLEDTSLGSSSWRVAHQIAFLADQFGETTDKGTCILLPLTHQDLADVLNLSRETVSRALTKLKDKNLIIAGQHIVVPDMAKLHDSYS